MDLIDLTDWTIENVPIYVKTYRLGLNRESENRLITILKECCSWHSTVRV